MGYFYYAGIGQDLSHRGHEAMDLVQGRMQARDVCLKGQSRKAFKLLETCLRQFWQGRSPHPPPKGCVVTLGGLFRYQNCEGITSTR